ncbi:hypothetical protein CHUAL_010838 [Chamberlinius hualienensis]
MDTDTLISELVAFLKSKPSDLRYAACQQVLGLLADDSGITLVQSHEELWKQLIHLACSDETNCIKTCSLKCLINLSSKEDLTEKILVVDDYRFLKECFKLVGDRRPNAEECTMLLSNLTRSRHSADLVWDVMQCDSTFKLSDLINLICDNKKSWDHLAQVLCNLSQLLNVRKVLTDEKQQHIKRLLNSMADSKSALKRRGIVGVIRNCCFDHEIHFWLLNSDIDIIPALVYPLAGPEELDEDENDKLPLELQYLDPDKERESDAEIRKLLLESLLQVRKVVAN